MKKILIVEDELITANDIKESLEMNGYMVTAMVRTGEKALRELQDYSPDAVIMDIHLAGELNGLETAEEIAVRKGIPVIFLTGTDHPETVNKIKGMKNVSFLSKPLRMKDFITNLAISINNYEEKNDQPEKVVKLEDAVFVPTKNGHAKLLNDDILYAEASGSYVTVYTNKDEIVISTNLGNLHKQLGNHIFIRISRKHLVNIHKIGKIEGNVLVINSHPLPVGESYRNEVFQKLQIIRTK